MLENHINRLTQLGLNVYEAKAYTALLGKESFSATQVADISGVPRQRIYDILSSLVERGLAISRPGRHGTKYAAVSPKSALSALLEREQQRLSRLETMTNELVDFARGTVDATIRAGHGKWQGLRADFLFRQHFTPICTRAFLEANAIERPEDLLRVERLAPNDPLWAGWFAQVGIETPPPRQGVVLDSQLQEATAIQGGFGVAMMTPMYWRAELDSGRLVQPFETLYVPGVRPGTAQWLNAQWLVHPEGRVGVRKIERFREWIHAELTTERDRTPPEIWKPFE